ncbi:MAG: pyrroline-5-carboxylate reductase [Oscillospiraceae bacterium]|nr:pyrroline-5-carboxylate reductase [Oscillospiraceae bacterium]
MKTAAFIGTGNMGAALARAVCRAVGAEQLILSNRTPEKAERLAEELGCAVAADNEMAVREGKYIFLCVKPYHFTDVAAQIMPVLEECCSAGEEKVLISVAAGLTLERLGALFGGIPVLRIMPNTCVEIGMGAVALSAMAVEEEGTIAEVEGMLRFAGLVERMDEHLMDQFTAVAGCGPAFVYPFIEAMADAGVLTGLPRGEALRYAAQTVMGAAAMVLETGKHPGELKDEVCSPGGSTIVGVAELERGGMRASVINAVCASYEKSGKMKA